ncbi:hypothetical protein [Flavilitoribacter nigricans]|uniref:Uncharacterized protein n=1 Tax=Flavilitoribacter nigricans (strain ATCC 23147 / DSM 23189 / NBRC 102662 / NCIMB 1420 / SS-2) TaxID=1122177 RepID=A0A2D0NFW2_FLAN2|nr:hypothetical protein [Flavilitoribacter nigricans]PHN07392.1 hypothetical protein CRP01_07115 [Flavilitoribacter nigricans DSM 23189 = NBRC 102662]
MDNQPSAAPNTPEWLKKLEEESWQAELIISGLAIYGTMQLPDLVEWLMDWSLASLEQSYFLLLYLFFTYLGLGAYMLIFIFIAHLVLRTVWIGLLGLNSVFPMGINENSETYSKNFLQQFKTDHSGEKSRIRQLDDVCSILFGFGAQLVMIFMAINLDIVVVGGIWYLLESFFGPTVSSIFGLIFLLTFLAYTVLFLISNTKKWRDKPFIKKWQYPIYKRASGIYLHLFAKPASYLGMIFQTNLSMKRYAGMVVLIMIFVLFFFGSRFFNYRFLSFMKSERLYEHFDRSDRLIPEHYANLRTDDRRLLSLELESDVISGDLLRVFVPMLSSESDIRQELCGDFDPVGSSREKSEQWRAYYTDCYQQMHRFYVNDSLYREPEMIKYIHPNQDEHGILVYLPTANFRSGRNLLRVEKIGPERDSVFRQIQAVFWLEQAGD